jgi:hypothetical protein
MNNQQKAKQTYLKITGYAPYREMNGIPREWFEKCIEKALDESTTHNTNRKIKTLWFWLWLTTAIGLIISLVK